MTDIASSPLDTDLCVHVDRRVDHPVGHVWGVVNSPQGVEAWLGSGASIGGNWASTQKFMRPDGRYRYGAPQIADWQEYLRAQDRESPPGFAPR